jgi:GGDEF domain-containing protein
VLRRLGARLAQAVRSSDLVARVGADAFGVLLRAGAPEEPLRAAVRLQEVLAAPIPLDDVLGHGDAERAARDARRPRARPRSCRSRRAPRCSPSTA